MDTKKTTTVPNNIVLQITDIRGRFCAYSRLSKSANLERKIYYSAKCASLSSMVIERKDKK